MSKKNHRFAVTSLLRQPAVWFTINDSVKIEEVYFAKISLKQKNKSFVRFLIDKKNLMYIL